MIADGDVGKLQPNFWVNNFMTLLSMQDSTSSAGKPLICEHCDSGDSAVSRCTNCRVFMCEFCVTAHKRINAFKSHQILSLAEVKKLGSKALVKPAFCVKHADETLKLFCDTCQKTICRDCTIVDHREHKYNFVADVAERERKVVQAVLEKTKAKDSAVEHGLKAVQAMESRIEAKIAEVSKEVDVFFDEQVKALEYLRANLKHDVTTQGQVKIKELGIQKEMLALSLAQLRSSIDFAERAIADGDDMELLTMKQQLVQRLAQLNTLQFQCKPCNTDYLELQVNKRIWDIGKMVTLLHTPVDTGKCVLSMRVGGEKGVLYETLAGQPVDFVSRVSHLTPSHSRERDERTREQDWVALSKPKTVSVSSRLFVSQKKREKKKERKKENGRTTKNETTRKHERKYNLKQELPVHDKGDSFYFPDEENCMWQSFYVESEATSKVKTRV